MIQGDLTDPKQVLDAIRGCSLVFHVASPDPNSPNRALLEAVNVKGTRNVVAACREAGVRSLVYTSSASVVFEGADQKGPTEAIGYPARYRDVYSETKARAERIVRRAGCMPVRLEGEAAAAGGKGVPQLPRGAEEDRVAVETALGYGADLLDLEEADGDGDWRAGNDGRLATASVRPHGIFGSRDRVLVPSLAAQGKAGRTKFRVGDGANVVDFTYVGNVAHAHMLAAERALPPVDSEAAAAALAACDGVGKDGDAAAALRSRLKGDTRVGVSGQTYFITNDAPIPFWEFLGRLLDGLGWPVPSMWLPYGFILPLATVADGVNKAIAALRGARPKPMTFSPARMQIVGTWHYYSCEAAKRELGYSPVWSMDEGVFLTLRAFAGHRNPQARPSKVLLEGERTADGAVLGGWQPAFAPEEVALHCTEDDLWVTIEGRVHDLTRFVPKHPGGGDKITKHAGRDATRGFLAVLKSHPDGVRDIARQFVIGTVTGGGEQGTGGAAAAAAGASGEGGFAALAAEAKEEEEG